jgi:hypothetical protein
MNILVTVLKRYSNEGFINLFTLESFNSAIQLQKWYCIDW